MTCGEATLHRSSPGMCAYEACAREVQGDLSPHSCSVGAHAAPLQFHSPAGGNLV